MTPSILPLPSADVDGHVNRLPQTQPRRAGGSAPGQQPAERPAAPRTILPPHHRHLPRQQRDREGKQKYSHIEIAHPRISFFFLFALLFTLYLFPIPVAILGEGGFFDLPAVP